MDKLFEEILKLSNRVAKIESTVDLKFWIAIGLSLLSIFITLIWNKFLLKRNEFNELKRSIELSKTNHQNKIAELSNMTDKELSKKLNESYLDIVLNNYDDGCFKFFNKRIIRKDFKTKYHQDIVDYVVGFPDKFQEPLCRHNNILEYYKKEHKHIK